MYNIVLYCPEIPQNTGNIVRTCAVTGSRLHLIKPYGFILNEKTIKRAGLDYWDMIEVNEYDDFDDFISKNDNADIYLVTSKSKQYYCDFNYEDNTYFVFGNETSGLPKKIHDLYKEKRIRIPMIANNHARCLNLSNSVGIILYEALRQKEFNEMV